MKQFVGLLLILSFGWVPFQGCATVSSPPAISEQELQTLRAEAEQGNAKAQTKLGSLYHFGQGVPQDYEKARQWFEKAAVQGDAMAKNWLGGYYESGLGVHQDYAKAYEWYEQAAIQGNPFAQYNLGVLYGKGLGVQPDFQRAFMWFDLAAAGMPTDKARKPAVENRDRVALRMTPEQIAEAQRLSQQCRARDFNGC